jgi:hypothetical protein
MHKVFKHITWMLTVAITLITCSGCFDKTAGEARDPGAVATLTTSPANITYRAMSEELYIGYLGAQRDFAILVDNLQYNFDNDKGGCQTNESIGCASVMGQLLIQHGFKATKFTGAASDKNVLVYYASAHDFMSFGSPSDDSWLNYLAPTSDNDEYGDFNRSENVLRNSCGTGSNDKICKYAKEMRDKGYSDNAGNAMLLFFKKGEFSGMITDKQIDPAQDMNPAGAPDYDNVIKPEVAGKLTYKEYYERLTSAVKSKVLVKDTTADSSVTATKRSLTQLNTLSELVDLVGGKGVYSGVKDYLLLITTEGFLEEKIGNNHKYETIEDAMNATNMKAENEGIGDAIEQAIDNIILLFNTASSFNDNCAVEADEFQNFLNAALEALLAVGAGAAIGAAVGSMIFPGIGTAVGAVIGGIIGFFANEAVKNLAADANGITGDKYCKIMTAALNDFEVNVPMYSYKISSFGDYKPMGEDEVDGNLSKYRKGTMDPLLKDYYDNNQTKCLTQNVKIGVANGIGSVLIGGLAKEYNYADKCEAAFVRQIVGGFRGSPSLLLFINQKQADDLHGRATTALVREMLFSWGLTQIGNIYTLLSDKSMAGMTVTVGGAQMLNNLRYCFSQSETPSCSGYSTTNVSHSNYSSGAYIGALKPEDGITIDFMPQYKSASNDIIRNASYSFDVPNLRAYNKNPSSYGWSPVSTDPSYIGENLDIATLESNIETKFSENIDSWYAVKYGDMIFLVSDNAIIGCESLETDGDIVVKYYWDGTTEYAFTESFISGETADATYLTRAILSNPSNVSIAGGHEDLYIYMEYSTNDGSSNVFTYML